jgi:hypothetical protein
MNLEGEKVTLKTHQLSHIPELQVDPILFRESFAAHCSIANCSAACCRFGVMIDPKERENILAHADLVKRHMDPHQEKNTSHWFDDWEEEDFDFPSGKCTGTQVRDYGCVFLNGHGHCVLQKAAIEEGMPTFSLKPFFCVAYPVTLENGTLTLESPEHANRPECCSIVDHGGRTPLDVCGEELQFILGDGGLAELEGLRPSKA